MKVASLRGGGRDGTLIVVSRDLSMAVEVPGVAATLQQAIDDWERALPRLSEVYDRLNRGHHVGAFPLRVEDLAAPLPRAYQWLDGSAYVNHVELVRKARGAEMPARFWSDPLMYQGASDDLQGPRDPILGLRQEWGIDFEAEVAVFTDGVPLGTHVAEAGRHIILLALVNDVSLRKLIPDELAKGFGFIHGKPATAFSPVAVTPDELGDAFVGYRVHLPLRSTFNGELFGAPNAGADMTFDFAQLVSHAARTRNLSPGTIIGSGTVSNLDRSLGSSCLAERRMLEQLERGQPETRFMERGDRIRIEMLDAAGRSIFGAIEQSVL